MKSVSKILAIVFSITGGVAFFLPLSYGISLSTLASDYFRMASYDDSYIAVSVLCITLIIWVLLAFFAALLERPVFLIIFSVLMFLNFWIWGAVSDIIGGKGIAFYLFYAAIIGLFVCGILMKIAKKKEAEAAREAKAAEADKASE